MYRAVLTLLIGLTLSLGGTVTAFAKGEVIWEGTQESKLFSLTGPKRIRITTEGVFINGYFKPAFRLSKNDACLYGLSNFPNTGYVNTSKAWDSALKKFDFVECQSIRLQAKHSYKFEAKSPASPKVEKRDSIKSQSSPITSVPGLYAKSDETICKFAKRIASESKRVIYQAEAKRRGLGCGVGYIGSTQAASTNTSDLPACPTGQDAYWHNCFGTQLWSNHKYVGEFKDGKRNGQFTVTYANGDKYVGAFKDDVFHGQGTYIFANGDKYIGEFKNNKRNGQFTVTYANGAKYVGEFKDNLFHGQGTLTLVNGYKYVGEFKDNKRNGQFTATYANGDKYVGAFKDDVFHGQGTYTFANGNRYIGEFKNDKYNGQGTQFLTNGNKYVGEFKDGKYNGLGTYTFANGNRYIGEFKDDKYNGLGTYTFANGNTYIGEFKDDKYNGQGTLTFADGRATKEGVWKDNKFQYAKKLTPSVSATELASSTTTQADTKTSAELLAAKKRAAELAKKLALLERKEKLARRQQASDKQVPTIKIIQSGVDGRKGYLTGAVTDNLEVAEVLVDGKPVSVAGDGSFEWTGFVPVTGKAITIEAIDTAALAAQKVIRLERGQIAKATGPVFDDLNPLVGKRVIANKNALALIVGIADYERTDAPAIYADKDAQYFHDYASLKLGIPDSNITTLLNEKAEQGDVLLAVKEWIRRSSKAGQSDVYIFFAGHGLASQDGAQMYLLPYDGRPRLLENTAILRDELFSDIAAANPRSVTVFLDTCYSGTTRGTETLIASRPIAIRAKEQTVPEGFTVMTAAAGDQTAKPLEEAKHGMFSYFLMKGMEGDADANQDNQITAGELHAYVQQNVIQQSSGSQTPELQGDADRVLVRFQ